MNFKLATQLIVARSILASCPQKMGGKGGIDFQPFCSGNVGDLQDALGGQADAIFFGVVTAIEAKIPLDKIFGECLATASYEHWRSKLPDSLSWPAALAFEYIPDVHRPIHKFLADQAMAVALMADPM